MSQNNPIANNPIVIIAAQAPLRKGRYPEPFGTRVGERERRPLGDLFGLKSFGVNLTRLKPGSSSALFHRHSRQDELVYILEGAPTLITEAGETAMEPGMCAGFAAGTTAHQLVNRGAGDVVYVEIGSRESDDGVAYPNDDLKLSTNAEGKRVFMHKDGTPY